MPGNDVGRLAKPDVTCIGRNRHFAGERVRAHLGALGLEVMLGLEPIIETQGIGEDPLSNLVNDGALRSHMNLGQRAIVTNRPVRGADGRQITRPVMEDADFYHVGIIAHLARPSTGVRQQGKSHVLRWECW